MTITFFPPPPTPVLPSRPIAAQTVQTASVNDPQLIAAKTQKPAAPNAPKAAPAGVPTEKLLQTFLDLVKIPSPSGQEEKVREYIENRLQGLGFAKLDKLSTQQNSYFVDKTGNLTAYLPSNAGSNKTLLINVHMDVVPPCLNVKPVIKNDPSLIGENRVVYSSGDTVLGGDDKSAIAPLLEALEVSLKNNQARPKLLLTITAQEETGSIGVAQMDPAIFTKAPTKADLAISFDINMEQGTVIYQAPQLTKWYATVKGRSAHAGMEPEKGINAMKAAILSAAQIPVGRLDEESTANIGTFNSGEKFNIVPERAEITGEVRSFTPNRVNQELSKVQKAFVLGTKQVPGSTFDFKYNTTIKTYKTDLDQPIFAPLKQALQMSNLPFSPKRTNGGSDANVFAQYGIPSVAMSGAYQNAHRTTEYVRVKDMADEARLMLNIWQAYAKAN